MSVTVDDRPMHAEQLGLTTVGQVIAHLQKENRLVVHVLIDGSEPDLDRLAQVKQSPLLGHTIYIETAEPRAMALDVLEQVEKQLGEADRMRNDAVELLQTNQSIKAMEKLRGCFSVWQHAEESIVKIAQLLRIDLTRIIVEEKPFTQMLGAFGEQLKRVKSALESRDFVALTDTLAYEMTQTAQQWRAAIQSIRSTIE
jgi:hypothetical protein